MLAGLVGRDLDTLSPVELPSITNTLGDIWLSEGRDILSVVNEYDLIGVQRVIIRKGVLPDDFVDSVHREFVMPIAICLAAGAKGPALIMGEKLSAFGSGDESAWRRRWPDVSTADDAGSAERGRC